MSRKSIPTNGATAPVYDEYAMPLSGAEEIERYENQPLRGKRAKRSKKIIPFPAPHQHDSDSWSQMGNACRLVKRHGHKIRYCADRGEWYRWDGTRWIRDILGETVQLAKETVLAIHASLGGPHLDEKQQRKLAQFAIGSQTQHHISGMLTLAQSDPAVRITSDQFDSDPWILNCRNGVVNLNTGALMPHRPDFLCTQRAEVDYDPNSTCPRWMSFLDEALAGQDDLIAYLQRVYGYALTGVTREQCFWCNTGDGGNGKSVMQVVIGKIMGDYASTIDPNIMLVRQFDSDTSYHLATLPRKRFVYASESGHTKGGAKALDEETIKRWTGNEPVVARRPRGEPLTFEPQFKLILAMNRFPGIHGTDDGIWRRVKNVPFNVKPSNPDVKLMEELLENEGPGILAWQVRGCVEYVQHGLQHPESIERSVKALRGELDTLGRFLDECCTVVNDPKAREDRKRLYGAYKSWCLDNGEVPKSGKELAADLVARKFVPGKHPTTRREVWVGIRLQQG